MNFITHAGCCMNAVELVGLVIDQESSDQEEHQLQLTGIHLAKRRTRALTDSGEKFDCEEDAIGPIDVSMVHYSIQW